MTLFSRKSAIGNGSLTRSCGAQQQHVALLELEVVVDGIEHIGSVDGLRRRGGRGGILAAGGAGLVVLVEVTNPKGVGLVAHGLQVLQ